MSNLSIQLRGYRLTTAEIVYRLPDHPTMLQSFIWQDLDLAPRFPRLNKFLQFWETSLDGRPLLAAACPFFSPSSCFSFVCICFFVSVFRVFSFLFFSVTSARRLC